MSYGKQKIFEILLTAILSAGIAFLQSIIAQNMGVDTNESVPFVAGIYGGIIKSCRTIKV